MARASDGEVVVDGGEIHEHAWLAAREVLDRRDRGEVDLAPPTWVTLHDLAAARRRRGGAADAPPRATRSPTTRPAGPRCEGGAVAMWARRRGLRRPPTRTPPGARHRLWMLEDGWRLERD